MLDDSQAGIKIAVRNTINFRYAGDTTLMAECKEELKSLLMMVKEESEKAGLILSIQTEGEKVETVTDFVFLGSKIIVESYCSHEIKRHLFLGRKAITILDSI